jgi:hypothetical protein
MSALDRLATLKGQFGAAAASQAAGLLERLRDARIRKPEELIRFHETVLYLRAYPQNSRVAELADEILFHFERRLAGVDHDPFEDPEISGIAGTGLSTNFSYEVARSLVARHPQAIHIDWENYEHADRLGPQLARFIPLAGEDATVEPHVDWRRWFESSGCDLPWLIERIEPAIYDLLEIPLRWELGCSAASRSRTRIPRREIYYHDGPFLTRRDVSLEAEFAAPAIHVEKVKHAQAMVDLILDTSAVRYRELWGFTHPDVEHVYHADFGRGVEIFVFGVPQEWRLPLRAYHGGMFFKNGVPMGYVEGLSLFERMEVGFNLYYTFREGESAWLYARLLKLFREQLGVTCYSVDPYQLGYENEEAIDSGAFWFYRKLGFRTTSAELASLIEREEKKIAANREYRTPTATLRKLAAAPLIYGGGHEWDHFELRKLGKMPRLSAELMKAKQAPEEAGYLRAMQKDRDLRKRVLSFKGGEDAVSGRSPE